jgi:hypothetical protein
MGVESGPSRGARIVHHGAEELLIEQDSVSEGDIKLPSQEGTQHTQTLGSPLPDLIDVRRPGQS